MIDLCFLFFVGEGKYRAITKNLKQPKLQVNCSFGNSSVVFFNVSRIFVYFFNEKKKKTKTNFQFVLCTMMILNRFCTTS